MSKIGNILYSSCDKVTGFIEKRSFEPLSIQQQIQLHLHLRICSACRRYLNQSGILDSLLQSTNAEDRNVEPTESNSALKEKIKQTLSKSAGKK